MGLLTGALQIGRSALLAYQSALQVVGNNISNAGSPGYTRQTPVMTPSTGVLLPEGFTPGGGVALEALRRNVDHSLENRLRAAIGQQSGSVVEQQVLGQLEGVLHELTDTDLSTLLQEFFNSCSSLQNQPHDLAARGMVLTAADSLIREIQRQRSDVLVIRDELNHDLEDAAQHAGELTQDIAALNVQITALESSQGGGANALRDQRDQLLRELAELLEIQIREQPDGGINVYAGNELLIQSGLNRGITSTFETVNGEPTVVVRFADNNGPIALDNGELAGFVEARDSHSLGYVAQLNSLAKALIQEVNKVHAEGQGLEGIINVVGTYDVLDSAAVLNSTGAGLDLTPRNGSFLITVTDQSSGTPTTTTITVDLDGVGTDDSLDSLVAQINANVANVTAAVTVDNRLQLTAATGFEMTFSEDSSHVLAALGINTFFTGRDAQDIAVNTTLTGNVNLLAAAMVGTTGDGSNAARIAALGTDSLTGLNGQSLTDFYNAIAANLAVTSQAAVAGVEAADAITLSLTAQRESISGVSLDEETISLLRFERAFQGAARYASIVDQLLEEMLMLVR